MGSLDNWTFKDVEKFLKSHGFQLHHTRGSHYYYVRIANGISYLTSVPHHGAKSIHPDTIKSIIKQSGVPKNKWTEE